MNTNDHALSNAEAWAESVTEYVKAMDPDSWDRLEELTDADSIDAGEAEELASLNTLLDEYKDVEGARERAQDSILSLEVRSGWNSPGEKLEPEEFQILLTTGGPALRIRGELGRYAEPERAWLEYQDWGTPWTEYHGPALNHADLMTFASIFYFGE